MTTDFCALCAELIEAVLSDDSHIDCVQIAHRASALLDQTEGEGLTDEELLAVLDKATADFPPVHPEARALNAVEYPLAMELRKARAAIAADRARHSTPQPELTHHITPDDFRRWWRETGSASPAPSPEMLLTANAWAQYCLDRWGRPTPQPPAEGEVVELVEWLGNPMFVRYALAASDSASRRLIRAAELLQRQHPQPVPVAIPGEEYHEDMGPVTWWRLPVEEPPWVGTPNDSDWPGYHTHFTSAPPEPCNAAALPVPTSEKDQP